jgi:hypothetical protein
MVVARQYYLRVSALFRAAHWAFARKQGVLSVLKAAAGTPENMDGTTLPIPPVPWQYEYAYPSDCIKVRSLIPNPPTSGMQDPPILSGGGMMTPAWFPWVRGYRFEIGVDDTNLQMPGGVGGDFSSDFGPDFNIGTGLPFSPTGASQIKVIFTDLEYANIVYTANIPNPDLWDPEFQNAAAASIGAWLVNPLNRNAELLREQIQVASSIIQAARIMDGNEGTETVDHVPDWMAVRGFGGFRELSRLNYGGWDSMTFPGGILV